MLFISIPELPAWACPLEMASHLAPHVVSLPLFIIIINISFPGEEHGPAGSRAGHRPFEGSRGTPRSGPGPARGARRARGGTERAATPHC